MPETVGTEKYITDHVNTIQAIVVNRCSRAISKVQDIPGTTTLDEFAQLIMDQLDLISVNRRDVESTTNILCKAMICSLFDGINNGAIDEVDIPQLVDKNLEGFFKTSLCTHILNMDFTGIDSLSEDGQKWQKITEHLTERDRKFIDNIGKRDTSAILRAKISTFVPMVAGCIGQISKNLNTVVQEAAARQNDKNAALEKNTFADIKYDTEQQQGQQQPPMVRISVDIHRSGAVPGPS